MNWEILLQLFTPKTLLVSFIGTLFGIIVGAIPGMNGAVGISLLLPLTFAMSPDSGLLMLGGIFMGSMYGGAITAILLNIPGTVVASCTAMEGFPMAKQGRAKEALYYSIFASSLGGLFGILVMIFFTPPLAKVALRFGPPEMFFISLCGLAMIGALSGKNMFKSFFAVAFGMIISSVGIDQFSGLTRYTFGIRELKAGINVLPVVIGVFCFSEMFLNLGATTAGEYITMADQNISRWTVLKSTLKHYKIILKSSILGTVVGILPGIGGTLPTFMSYAEAKRSSKHPELFGKGNPEGIIAAESANNSVVGGAMVPLLALGVPGSSTAAILGGALAVHGIIAGPELFSRRPDVAYIFIYGMLLTVVAMFLIGTFGIKYFSYILKIKIEYLLPVIFVLSIFGAYSLSNRVFDVYIALSFGILGALFKKIKIPIAPIVIGLVLGPLIEVNFRRTLQMSSAIDKPLIIYVLTRPVSIILMILMVILFYAFFSMKERE